MRVRIGVADSAKTIEIDVDDMKSFKKTVVDSVKSGEIAWFTDSKGHEVGVPAGRISYVEIEADDSGRRVGFGPAV